MPRHARIDLPGIPHHICIRAVDGMPCLIDDFHRTAFLRFLLEAMEGAAISLHAYVLMGNHVHMLVTCHAPGEMSRVMHSVCLRFASYFNRQHDRRGPLFQGRFWASPVETERYFFECMRYIELNPVRAGLVALPAAYAWSSHAHNAGLDVLPGITPHEVFLQLGRTPEERGRAWSDFVSQGICDDELQRIRKNLRQNRPYGSVTFEKEKGRVQEPSPFA